MSIELKKVKEVYEIIAPHFSQNEYPNGHGSQTLSQHFLRIVFMILDVEVEGI
jgi:hypothetical protein